MPPRFSEDKAFEKICTRNCDDSFVANIRTNMFVLLHVGTVIFAVLWVVGIMTETVHEEVVTLTKIYDKYYAKIRKREKKRRARKEAIEQFPDLDGHIVVESPYRYARAFV